MRWWNLWKTIPWSLKCQLIQEATQGNLNEAIDYMELEVDVESIEADFPALLNEASLQEYFSTLQAKAKDKRQLLKW